MALAEGNQVVEALSTGCPHPAFRDGVRARRLNRGPQTLDSQRPSPRKEGLVAPSSSRRPGLCREVAVDVEISQLNPAFRGSST